MAYSFVSCSPACCSVGGFFPFGEGGAGELFTANDCQAAVAVSVLAWSRML